MKKEEMLPMVLGAVVTGFSIGLGFIMAQKLVAKLGSRESVESEELDTKGKSSPDNVSNFGGGASSGWDTIGEQSAYDYYRQKPPLPAKATPKSFNVDLTTGKPFSGSNSLQGWV